MICTFSFVHCIYFIFQSILGTPRHFKILMYENKEKPELELCYEKRELQSGSYARKNQGLWS